MLHELLEHYLDDIDIVLRNLAKTYAEKYETEILSAERLNLRIRLRFENGNLFELNEALIVENEILKHLGYRYHFQDEKSKLVFRYDNTPHFPDLNNFPDHKHMPDNVIECNKPDASDVIAEAVKECGC